MLLSSQRDNYFIAYYTLPSFRRCVLFLSATSGPHSVAVAVTAKNIPPECFPDAATVLKEIITAFLAIIKDYSIHKSGCCFFIGTL